MDPNAFIAEVYRRMAARYAGEKERPSWQQMESHPPVLEAIHQYARCLPADKGAHILDIGFGSGWFLAACLKLGYTNLCGADFGLTHKSYIRDWAPERISLFEIPEDIGEFLKDKKEQFDFIHLAHVIEHVPKYSLFWIVDAVYWALKVGGSVLLRTPNMEGPCANSSSYVTLSHEYGFAGSNLISLLDICGFDDVHLVQFPPYAPTMKQKIGNLMRWPVLQYSRFQHRLFGVNHGGNFGSELVVTGKRGNWPPYLHERYK